MDENIPIGEPVEEKSKVSYVVDVVKDQFSRKNLGRNIMIGLSLVNSAGFSYSLATGSTIGSVLCGTGMFSSLTGVYLFDIDAEEEERFRRRYPLDR